VSKYYQEDNPFNIKLGDFVSELEGKRKFGLVLEIFKRRLGDIGPGASTETAVKVLWRTGETKVHSIRFLERENPKNKEK